MEHIDIQGALALLGGSKKLYAKLLSSFYKKYKDMQGSLEDLVATGNFEEARRLAHSIKGLCGNLGAGQLQDLSKQLEYAYRDKDTVYIELLPKFYQELHIIIGLIPGLISDMGEDLDQEVFTSANKKASNSSQYDLLLKALHEALGKFKYSEVKTVLSKIQTYEIPNEYVNHMPKVFDAIKHFDYKEAAILVESLLKE